MSLQIGIVGLANVGKSTLFNALTNAGALAANYPFATIEPNTGIVGVPDERLAVLAKMYDSDKVVPATVEFVDIAGLIAGASKGEGLGNKFLVNIRECKVICHVVRAFADANVGVNKTVTISGLALGGDDAGNYVLAESDQQESTTANITARAIPLKKGSFANQLGHPDYIFVCMDTVSHPLVISAQKEAKKHGARLVKLRRGSASALERELIRVTAQA